MKHFKLIIGVIIVFSFLQTNGFALITSRVTGTIIDKATGAKISGADVVLLSGRYVNNDGIVFGILSEKKSSSRGFFKFDQLSVENRPVSSYYFLAVFKKGYADYGPFGESFVDNIWYDKHRLFNDLEYYGVKEGLIDKSDVNIEKIDFFKLKQGEIKHFIISLEKEAVLDFKMFRKTPQGTIVLDKKIVAQINIYHNKYLEGFKYFSSFRLEGLKDGIAAIQCYPYGYPRQVFKNINLEKGKTTSVELVLDFTTGQVLHGFVKKKETGKPFPGVIIRFDRIINGNEEYAVEDIDTDRNGEFWIGGFEPGKYSLEFINFYRFEFRHKEILEFGQGEKKEITKEF
jgi:hypothetical protein